MKHLEQQILDLITDEVFAKRLANELFIAMQKNDIYEQVKFESRESIEANIERLEKELEKERIKLDIVIPQAKAFNELQKDVDKALEERTDGIDEKAYQYRREFILKRLDLKDKDNNYINKLIHDNMTCSELDDLIKDKPIPVSNEIFYKKIVAEVSEEVLSGIIDRIANDNPYLSLYDKTFKSNLNLKEKYDLFHEALGLQRVPTYIIDKVIVDNLTGKELVGVVNIINTLPSREKGIISNADIVTFIDMVLFRDILQRIDKNEADLKFLAENDIENKRYKKSEDENQVVRISGGCSLPKGFAKNLRLDKKEPENKNQSTEEDDIAIDYFDGKGSCAIGLGKSEAERKETLQERAKKVWEKYRNK